MSVSEINLSQVMRQRVERHIVQKQKERVRNPAIPDDLFDFSESGLPSEFVYHPVEVPNSSSPLYANQLGALQNYLHAGFEFLTTELATRDGRDGTAMIPELVEIDGRVVVAGCYILFADRDWYQGNRNRNIAKRNKALEAQTEAREESLGQLAGNPQGRVVHSTVEDVTNEQLDKEEGVATGDED